MGGDLEEQAPAPDWPSREAATTSISLMVGDIGEASDATREAKTLPAGLVLAEVAGLSMREDLNQEM